MPGGNDVFAAKLNPAGNGLVYCTYLGGSGDDRAANTLALLTDAGRLRRGPSRLEAEASRIPMHAVRNPRMYRSPATF